VAVTRQRQKLTVVSSFSHSDIDLSRVRPGSGIEFLRNYLEYAASNGKRLGDADLTSVPLNAFAFLGTKQTKVQNRVFLSQKTPNEIRRHPDSRLADWQVERAFPAGFCQLSENTSRLPSGYCLSELPRPSLYVHLSCSTGNESSTLPTLEPQKKPRIFCLETRENNRLQPESNGPASIPMWKKHDSQKQQIDCQ
jgi:hypothetical protein